MNAITFECLRIGERFYWGSVVWRKLDAARAAREGTRTTKSFFPKTIIML
jgi:hypothetical protein